MARFSRLDVLNTTIDIGLVPVFYQEDLDVAKRVAAACIAGGARVLEFTNRGDFAPGVFKGLSRFLALEHPEAILGVGTVADAPTAALYIAHGANFVVGPMLNPEVARLCNRRKIAYLPGCATLSEIGQAEELGVEIVKVFPATCVGGPTFIKAVQGPCPWTRIMPTGGVNASLESMQTWFGAGIACIGMGSQLIRKDWLATGDWVAITEQVRCVLAWIAQARG